MREGVVGGDNRAQRHGQLGGLSILQRYHPDIAAIGGRRIKARDQTANLANLFRVRRLDQNRIATRLGDHHRFATAIGRIRRRFHHLVQNTGYIDSHTVAQMHRLHVAYRGFIHRVDQLRHALHITGVVRHDDRVVTGVGRNRTVWRQQRLQNVDQIVGRILLDLEYPRDHLITVRVCLRHHGIALDLGIGLRDHPVNAIDLDQCKTG